MTTRETPWVRLGYPLYRLRRFLQKPAAAKTQSLRFRVKRLWHALLPWIPLPIRLPFGGWWLAWNDVCSDAVFSGGFEMAEWRFVERFLTPGMTVLDIGAHHGFYTLLASRKVGIQGKVVAFEPSPRERQRLLWHLRLNRCGNVQVEGLALGSYEGKTSLYVVNGRDTGCNSLRPPNVAEPTGVVRVPVLPLDSYLRRHGIEQIDFVKMDVEGAEIEVLYGATEFLRQEPSPLWLVEVQDIRAQPWGYRAAEIVEFLCDFGYRWFKILENGALAPVSVEQWCFDPESRVKTAGLDGQLLAVRGTRLERVQELAAVGE